MRKTIFAMFFLFVLTAFPQTLNLLNDNDCQVLKLELDSLLTNKFFISTQISISAYDLTSNKTLYQKNENLLFKPASNLKLFTVSAALKFLGADYNFKTTISYTGGILKGILYGDLYVIGGCDPDFTVQNIDSLALMVKHFGINRITGNVYGDVSMMDSLFWGKGWMWDDDPSTDAPYLTPLCINKNSVDIIVKPSVVDSPPLIQLIPKSDYIKIENDAFTVAADSENTISVSRDWLERKNTIKIDGIIKSNFLSDSLADTVRVNIFKPELLFLDLFKNSLIKNGVEIKGISKIKNAPFFVQNLLEIDRPIKSILPGLIKNSDNLDAEMLLYALSANFFGKPATAQNGVKMEDSLITILGFNPLNYKIVDGSGVSHYNLISTNLIISLLKYIYFEQPEIYKLVYTSLPVAGVDGTLKNRMVGTSAQNNVHAKTGTLSGVSCLSGYLHNNDGHLIAFSIMIQNFVGNSSLAQSFQDAICNFLINQ